MLQLNEYKGPNICTTCYTSTSFNYTISGTEFCEFDVLDLIIVLAASKVATILLMVIGTHNILYSCTLTSGDHKHDQQQIYTIITIYGRCQRRSDIDDTSAGTITNVIGCVFEEIWHKFAFVDQIKNQIVVENEHCCNENTLFAVVHSNIIMLTNKQFYS